MPRKSSKNMSPGDKITIRSPLYHQHTEDDIDGDRIKRVVTLTRSSDVSTYPKAIQAIYFKRLNRKNGFPYKIVQTNDGDWIPFDQVKIKFEEQLKNENEMKKLDDYKFVPKGYDDILAPSKVKAGMAAIDYSGHTFEVITLVPKKDWKKIKKYDAAGWLYETDEAFIETYDEMKDTDYWIAVRDHDGEYGTGSGGDFKGDDTTVYVYGYSGAYVPSKDPYIGTSKSKLKKESKLNEAPRANQHTFVPTEAQKVLIEKMKKMPSDILNFSSEFGRNFPSDVMKVRWGFYWQLSKKDWKYINDWFNKSESKLIKIIRKMIKEEVRKVKIIKEQDDDMMSPEEIKDEVINIITRLKNSTNQWTTRDTLKDFTSWGFWTDSGGDIMASIDIPMADKIANKLLTFAKSLTRHGDIEELYDKLYDK